MEKRLQRLARVLGVPQPTFMTSFQQVRGSSDCGIFALGQAYQQQKQAVTVRRKQEHRPITLRAARAELVRWQGHGEVANVLVANVLGNVFDEKNEDAAAGSDFTASDTHNEQCRQFGVGSHVLVRWRWRNPAPGQSTADFSWAGKVTKTNEIEYSMQTEANTGVRVLRGEGSLKNQRAHRVGSWPPDDDVVLLAVIACSEASYTAMSEKAIRLDLEAQEDMSRAAIEVQKTRKRTRVDGTVWHATEEQAREGPDPPDTTSQHLLEQQPQHLLELDDDLVRRWVVPMALGTGIKIEWKLRDGEEYDGTTSRGWHVWLGVVTYSLRRGVSMVYTQQATNWDSDPQPLVPPVRAILPNPAIVVRRLVNAPGVPAPPPDPDDEPKKTTAEEGHRPKKTTTARRVPAKAPTQVEVQAPRQTQTPGPVMAVHVELSATADQEALDEDEDEDEDEAELGNDEEVFDADGDDDDDDNSSVDSVVEHIAFWSAPAADLHHPHGRRDPAGRGPRPSPRPPSPHSSSGRKVVTPDGPDGIRLNHNQDPPQAAELVDGGAQGGPPRCPAPTRHPRDGQQVEAAAQVDVVNDDHQARLHPRRASQLADVRVHGRIGARSGQGPARPVSDVEGSFERSSEESTRAARATAEGSDGGTDQSGVQQRSSSCVDESRDSHSVVDCGAMWRRPEVADMRCHSQRRSTDSDVGKGEDGVPRGTIHSVVEGAANSTAPTPGTAYTTRDGWRHIQLIPDGEGPRHQAGPQIMWRRSAGAAEHSARRIAAAGGAGPKNEEADALLGPHHPSYADEILGAWSPGAAGAGGYDRGGVDGFPKHGLSAQSVEAPKTTGGGDENGRVTDRFDINKKTLVELTFPKPAAWSALGRTRRGERSKLKVHLKPEVVGAVKWKLAEELVEEDDDSGQDEELEAVALWTTRQEYFNFRARTISSLRLYLRCIGSNTLVLSAKKSASGLSRRR